MDSLYLVRAASNNFGSALRARASTAASMMSATCGPLLPSESPSKSKAGRYFVHSSRSGRLLFTACAASVALCAVVALVTAVAFARRHRSAHATAALSLRDYPDVFVADSPGFKDIEPPLVVAPGVRGGRVPSRDEVEVPAGVGGGFPALRIVVLTMDRKRSLTRLYRSLVAADYAGRRVDLDFWIDRVAAGGDGNGEELMGSMMALCRTFEWNFGVRTIHARTENAGLYEQWIYSWNPAEHSQEMGLILEDDLEVSPHFFTWLRQAQAVYASDPHVAALTLQRAELRPRQVKGVATGKLAVSSKIPVFKYRLLGTWGFAPERKAWAQFRQWYEEMREKELKPYVPHLMTTDWYKSQEKASLAKGLNFANTMWSQWFIKWADLTNKFTVYANLPDGTTLAANHREAGMHYNNKPRSVDFEVFNSSSEVFTFPKGVPYLDWDGREIRGLT